jgi:hypothetical protein
MFSDSNQRPPYWYYTKVMLLPQSGRPQEALLRGRSRCENPVGAKRLIEIKL